MKKLYIIPKIKDRLNTQERIGALRMVRDDICGEYNAIRDYEEHILTYTRMYEQTGEEIWKKLITATQDIINEERSHVGELNKLLSMVDPSEGKQFNEGVSEVSENIQRIKSIYYEVILCIK